MMLSCICSKIPETRWYADLIYYYCNISCLHTTVHIIGGGNRGAPGARAPPPPPHPPEGGAGPPPPPNAMPTTDNTALFDIHSRI